MRLIDAEELVLQVDCLETCRCRKAKDWMIPISEVCREICEAPTIDAVPVKHGEWEYIGGYGYQYRCSKCVMCAEHKTRYCPNCGAKMEVQG